MARQGAGGNEDHVDADVVSGPGDDIRVDVILIAPRTLPRHIENAWMG